MGIVLDAIKRPFVQKSSKLLFFKSLIPIYNLAYYGYAYECARETLKGRSTLPEWDKLTWTQYIINTFGVFFVVGFYYMAIPIVLSIIFFYKIYDPFYFTSSSESILYNLLLFTQSAFLLKNIGALLFLLAILLLLIITIYILPAATILYIKNWQTKEAHNFQLIREKIINFNYFKYWIFLSILFFIVNLVINTILGFIPFGKFFSIGIVAFIVYIPYWTVYAKIISQNEISDKMLLNKLKNYK